MLKSRWAPPVRNRLVPALTAALVATTLLACTSTKEVPVQQTVVVEQTKIVVATATPQANRARATAIAFGTQVTSDGIPVNPRNAFPSNTSQIHAIVLVENAPTGTTITGTWFQLGTLGAGEEGQPIVTGDVILSQVSPGGRSRVTFTLKREGGALPRDAWLFRVYANGVLLKTSSFVISDAVPSPPRTPGTTSSLLQHTVDGALALYDTTVEKTRRI